MSSTPVPDTVMTTAIARTSPDLLNDRSRRREKQKKNKDTSALIPRSGPEIPANTPESTLPGDIVTSKLVKYAMNTDKALAKKLNAANRDVLYEIDQDKSGAGIMIYCQAGLYELIRRASCQYYGTFNKAGLRIEADVLQDNTACIAQITFKIKTYSNISSYVVSMYHTKSTLHITGRSAH